MISLLVAALLAQAPAKKPVAPTTVYVGAYAYSISEVNMAAGTFLWDGYLWFRWQGDALGSDGFDFVVINGILEHMDESAPVHQGDVHRQSRRVTMRLRADFDLKDYPFDAQVLPMVIEHRWFGDDQLVFVPDDGAVPQGRTLANAFLAEELRVGDWNVREVRHRGAKKTYETDFGSIQKGVWAGTSSRYVLEVEIRRALLPYVLKFVLPLLLIVAMGFSVFFISPKEFSTQCGIVITALLACVAFHMSQANSLPEVGYLVKADVFFLLSYGFIFFALAAVVGANRLVHVGKPQRAEWWIDRLRLLLPLGFVGCLAGLLITR